VADPSATRRGRGSGPAALVAVLVLGFFFGVVPVWQYLAAQRPPSGATVRTATVSGVERGPRGSDRGRLVAFELEDGTDGRVYLDSRFDQPDDGDRIEVYRAGDRWRSPAERSTYGLVGGVAALLLCGLLVVGWIRLRRVPDGAYSSGRRRSGAPEGGAP
jgi:hypothetical protein